MQTQEIGLLQVMLFYHPVFLLQVMCETNSTLKKKEKISKLQH